MVRVNKTEKIFVIHSAWDSLIIQWRKGRKCKMLQSSRCCELVHLTGRHTRRWLSMWNLWWFLVAFKSHRKQIRKGLLPEELPDDPMDVVELGFSSTESILCMKGECNNCNGSSLIDEICKIMEVVIHWSVFPNGQP